MFIVVPVVLIGLSFAGPAYVIALVSIIGIISVLVLLIKMLQKRAPNTLPTVLLDWKWLPLPLRSLKPYDDLFSKLPCCAKCRAESDEDDKNEKGNFVNSPSSNEAELNKRNSRISNNSSKFRNMIEGNINKDANNSQTLNDGEIFRNGGYNEPVKSKVNNSYNNTDNSNENRSNNYNSEARARNSELGSDNPGFQ